MRKIHKASSLAAVLHLAAITCLLQGYSLIPAVMALLAFFLVIRDLPVYTSIYQFIMVFSSCLLLGLSIDLPNGDLPVMSIAMLLLACTAVARIAFFRIFSYTSYSWMEPLSLILAIPFYLLSNLLYHHDWKGYILPLPVFIFDAVFTWGTMKDKNQLLKRSRGGYRVQIGKDADDFELPDQYGKPVRLSQYRGERHILLIFVRGDWCPGCHMMLRTYEKNSGKFKEKNILVMAIGPDPVGVNRQMVEKLGLDFKVLADDGQRTAMVYGVQLREYDNDFAEKYEEGIPLPASFLIDKEGIVRYVSRPDKVGEFLNPSQIFPIIDQLSGFYKRSRTENGKVNMNPVSREAVATSEELRNPAKSIASLKKELNNYESIIDQANDAMLVIDIVDGRVHQSNPSAARLLHYTKEELEGLSLFDLHPEEFLDKSSRVVADVWEQGGLIYTDIPFLTKTGELIPVECSAKVAPYSGRPAIVIYARDIRERLRLEAEITLQRKVIDEKNKDITDSIEYSKRIQRSIFIEQDKLKTYLPDSFIFFRPKDVVSGDFYWFSKRTIAKGTTARDTEVLAVAAADCTGHGVPGAFMSIIGSTLLNQTLSSNRINTPAAALDYANEELKNSLNKNQEDTPLRDGMDIALCYIDMKQMNLEFAGANNPAYIVRGGELIVLKADKQPITASRDSGGNPFTNQQLSLQKGDTIYLFTDGFADQFGGKDEKKFMYKRFKETLLGLQNKAMREQRAELEAIFEDWKGSLSQVDDVLVIGLRI